MTEDELKARTREALGLTTAHNTTIDQALDETVRFFLRNYNFPRAGQVVEFNNLAAGVQSVTLATPSKVIHLVQIRDNREATTYYKDLERKNGFELPRGDGVPHYWWQIGNVIHLDTPLPEADLDILVTRQHLDATLGLSFMLEEFDDVLFVRLCYYLAPTMRKFEAMQAFSPLWAEAQASIAHYANEQEFAKTMLQMRRPNTNRNSAAQDNRYPAGQ